MSGVSPAMPALRGLRVRGVAAAILVVLALLVGYDLPRVLPLQGAWFDALERRAPRPVATTPVTIVEIDDKSLAALGRWPWPRSLVAELVRRIAAFSPGVIGLDIVMPEPDPLSPEQTLAHVEADAALRERIAALPSNDAQLAAALHSAPTVLAMVGAPERTAQALRAAPILAGGEHDDAALVARATARLASYPGALSSVGVLTNAARGWGLISAEDTRGVVRQIPLVANVNGTLVPALAVEMWRVALGARALRLSIEHGAVSAVRIGSDTFRTEADGSARPWFSVHRPERFVSAVDVLNGAVDGDRLRRSFVLIGVTGLALGDYVWTPVEKMPGVEVHAQTLESMNERAFLVRPRIAPVVESTALLVAGGLLIAWMPGWPVRHGAMAAVACAVAFGALSYAGFREQRLLFDAATPAVALALLFAMLLALQLADSTRHRKALQRVLQHERVEAARVAGELQAARRVQLDSLPRTDAVRDSRVELAAVMEPALEVGGDLYDFYLLDADRLFFMLGDVSGKGLAASIFMAVSKALCKSTMLRAKDADLGLLLTHANAEVGRDNPGALFVTAFAGVLDLRTGMLDYCNAGQEDPWRRDAPRGTVSRLAGGGGPPLCVVDDFAYRSMRVALRPDELVCVVSDGVTEANDPSGAMYGASRVASALAGVTSATLAIAAIRDDVSRFAEGAPPSDDRTVLALRWRGS